MEFTCKRCGAPHDGSFATGTYCSRSCANKREYDPLRKLEVYKMVSRSLSERNTEKKKEQLKSRECPACHNAFMHKFNKTCSKKCGIDWSHRSEIREQQSRDTAER